MRLRDDNPDLATTTTANRALNLYRDLPQDAVLSTSGVIEGKAFRAAAADGVERFTGRVQEAVSKALEKVPGDYKGEFALAARFETAAIPDLVAVVPLRGRDGKKIASALLPAVMKTLSPTTALNAVATVAPRKTAWGTVNGWKFPMSAVNVMEGLPDATSLLFPREMGLWYAVVGDRLWVSVSVNDSPLTWLATANSGGATMGSDKSVSALRAELPNTGQWVAFLSPSQFLKTYGSVLSLILPEAQRLSQVSGELKPEYSLAMMGENREGGTALTVALRVKAWQPIVQVFRSLSQPPDNVH